ncbi:MAG: phosphohydrolase, partial [Bacteroidota bacterium]
MTQWIQTFSGIAFWPLDPKPEHVRIADIAHALSMKCRYNGHTRKFYSVAEHSVLVSRHVPEEDALWALLHDAS